MLSEENDALGKMGIERTEEERAAFAERERARMERMAHRVAEELGLDEDAVQVVTDVNEITEPKLRKAKGWFDPKPGKITVVIPNHTGTGDVLRTMLHEAVAHKGLRGLFGKRFDVFLDNVYAAADETVRRRISTLAAQHGWDFRRATEEYLAGMADAVKLCFDARRDGARYGDIVSTYARQGVLFADPDQLQTVADFNNATMLMLADVLNDKRVTLLKTTLQLYNNHARQSASGQADLFTGGIRSREDILREVINYINDNYGKRKEIEAARAEAVERRKAESVQQNGTPPAVSTDGEATAEPGAEPAPVEAEPVEANEPVEADPNAVQTALAAAEKETNTEPTEAQKEAGNYKKGHVKIDGYDVTIENPKGSVRRGTDASGKQWEQEMHNTYGYIRGTEGVDGDHIDVFFSDDPSQGDVFVVDQVNKDGSFDEHKVMYGFASEEEARKAYLSNYEDGWTGLGTITPVSKEEFKKWVQRSRRKTKPFAEYKGVKALEAATAKTDRQGNPLNDDGTLKLEKVSSVDELTDEDFSNPTRNVELPALPENVDKAIVANGKPVVIKKNIFERNAARHGDLSADDSRDILKSALYNPNLYGQNQKTKRPYNWVVINTKDKAGNNRLVLLELSPQKENVEIVHWHYVDEKGLEKIKRQAEREDGQLLILPSETEEAGALSSPTPDLSSVGKDKAEKADVQTPAGENAENAVDKEEDKFKEAVTSLLKALQQEGKTDEEIERDVRALLETFSKPTLNGIISSYLASLNTKNPQHLKALSRLEQALKGMGITVKQGARGIAAGDVAFTSAYDEPFTWYTVQSAHTPSAIKQQKDRINSLVATASNQSLTPTERANALNELRATIPHYAGKFEQDGQFFDDRVSINEYLRSIEEIKIEGKDKTLPRFKINGYYRVKKPSKKKAAQAPAAENAENASGEKGSGSATRALDGVKEMIAATARREHVDDGAFRKLVESLTYDELKDALEFADKKKGRSKTDRENIGFLRDIIKYMQDEMEYAQDTDAAEMKGYEYIMKLSLSYPSDFDFADYAKSKERDVADYERRGHVGHAALNRGILRAAMELQSKASAHEQDVQAPVEKNEQLNEKESSATSSAHERGVQTPATGNEQLNEKERRAKEAVEALRKKAISIPGITVFEFVPNYYKDGSGAVVYGTKTRRNVIPVNSVDEQYVEESVNIHLLSDEKRSDNEALSKVKDANSYANYLVEHSGVPRREANMKALHAGNEMYNFVRIAKDALFADRWAREVEIPLCDAIIGKKKDVQAPAEEKSQEGQADGAMLYHKEADGAADAVTSDEAALRDALMGKLQEAGIEVVTDAEEAQRVLDEVNGDDIRQQKVYHGSGADFNTFDHSHMGEGEGAQHYGWGSYVTEVEGIGRTYAMANNNSLRRSQLESNISRLKEALPFRRGDARREGEEEPKRIEEELSRFNEIWKSVLYTVEIPDDNGKNYLHWEKKMPKRLLDKVNRFLESIGERTIDSVYPSRSDGRITNEDLYDALSQWPRNKKKASEILRLMGYTGISYPAEFRSGGRNDGARNYVIFNEADARITEKVRFFRTPDGHAYGFTAGGKIYIDPRIAKADTPIHEYTHLWSAAVRKGDAKAWADIVRLMQGTPLWDEVAQHYPELADDVDALAEEVLAHFSGRRGAERLREAQRVAMEQDGLDAQAAAVAALERVRQALKRFWRKVADFFGRRFTTADEVADTVLADMLNGVKPAFDAKDGGVRYDANSEEAAIVARAKADGTYMKAPNGQPSKLTPRQWVQVRTKAFKEWFGDWEKAARVEMIQGLSAIGINPHSLSKDELHDLYRTFKPVQKDGHSIAFYNGAFKKIYKEGGLFAKIVPQLRDVFEQSLFAYEEADSLGGTVRKDGTVHKEHKNIVHYQNYVGKVDILGNTYYVRFTVQEEQSGLMGTHSFFVSNVDVYDNPTENRTIPITSRGTTDFDGIADAKLKKFFEEAKNSSRVVDENGEPRVVYHQTNSTIFVNRKTGENFDNLNWKEKDYWKNEASEEEWNDTWEEQDFYSFDNQTHGRRSSEMPAFFFSPVYDEYHEYGDRTVAAFLNIRNPIVNPDIPNRGVTDTAGEDAMNALIAQGYDGFIREYDGELDEINAFFPTQIKSAEENVGTFDGRNPDIRYQFVGERGAAAMDKAEEASVRLDNLAVAREMEASGKDAKAVKFATGWERGADGKWRYEIGDGKLKEGWKEKASRVEGASLSDVLDNEELFNAYPQLRSISVSVESLDEGTYGEYRHNTQMIALSDKLVFGVDGVLSHEVQHAIQYIEGFAKGGSPKGVKRLFDRAKSEWLARSWAAELEEKAREMGEHYNQAAVYEALVNDYKGMERYMPNKEERIKGFNYFARGYADRSLDNAIEQFRLNERTSINSYDEYLKIAGEVEARNVSKRLGMPAEERRRSLASETEDVAREDQIFLEEGVGVSASQVDGPVDLEEIKYLAERMDKQNGTEVVRFVDFLNRGKLNENESRYFHVGETGKLLNRYGITGKITISSSAANSHHNEDSDHLSAVEWVKVFGKINEPIAITRYGEKTNSFRIYTVVEKNGKNVCVGLNVNSVGRNVKISNIKTGFARDIANALNEKLVYPVSRAELETAIRELSLRHNREVYPEQPYDAAKVVETFENPTLPPTKNSETDGDTLLLREGDGVVSDAVLSEENDALGEMGIERTEEERAAFAERERARMERMAHRVAEELGLDEDAVQVVTDVNEITEPKLRKAKGWFDPKPGKITVVIPNHTGTGDVLRTMLHEAVAHKGLRGLFGKRFDVFLDNVYAAADETVRRRISTLAAQHGWDFRRATEEYLAGLADAVKLCFDARRDGARYGDIVSNYARQGVLFADPDQLQTVADFNNATMLMLADVLNDKRVTLLKTTLQLYNNHARQSASGQADLFTGGIRSREDILREVIN